jgi:hypothetical protein
MWESAGDFVSREREREREARERWSDIDWRRKARGRERVMIRRVDDRAERMDKT